jgi:hypothetical protein
MLMVDLNSQARLNSIKLIKTSPPANGYALTWLDGNILCMIKISEQVPAQDYFNEVADGNASSWQADHIIDLSHYEGWEKYFRGQSNECDLTVTSVAYDKSDSLTLTATNSIGKTFKFTKRIGQWRAFDESGEIHPIAMQKVAPTNYITLRGGTIDPVGTLALTNSQGIISKIDVSLLRQEYDPNARGRIVCYQLVESTNNSIADSRAIWMKTAQVLHSRIISLVGNGSGNGYYLALSDFYNRLCLSEISGALPTGKPLDDPEVGILSHPKDDPYVRGGVDHIIDLRQFDNSERFFKGGGGVASASQENNVLTLTVTNAAGSKFTFSNQDGQWHAYSYWGEINRIKK